MASPYPLSAPVRLALLALPPLLAAGLYWQGQHYDHGPVELRPSGAQSGATALTARLPASLGGRQRMGTPRPFSRDSLYEYVNGHAEYYLTAGFEGLAVGEYGADAQGQPSLVVNLWDMGKPLHAFGVLMDEAGADAAPLAGDVLGFRTSNGLSVAHGRYYLQVNGYAPGADAAAGLPDLLSALGPAEQGGAAVAHFPALGRVAATRFVKEGYRGLDMLANALVRRGRFRGRAGFELMMTAPLVMPEVIVGLSMLLLFVAMEQWIGWPDGRGFTTIAIAHITFSLAYVAVVVKARLGQMDRSLEEAAMDLGARPFKVFLRITLPLMAPALLSGWLLAFTLSLDDLVVSSFVAGPGSTTLPMVVYSSVRMGVSPQINALATLIVLFVSVAVVIAGLAMRGRSQPGSLIKSDRMNTAARRFITRPTYASAPARSVGAPADRISRISRITRSACCRRRRRPGVLPHERRHAEQFPGSGDRVPVRLRPSLREPDRARPAHGHWPLRRTVLHQLRCTRVT